VCRAFDIRPLRLAPPSLPKPHKEPARHDLETKYDILLGHLHPLKVEPKAFKQFYRGVTEDSPYEEQRVARRAYYDEQGARNAQLIHVTLGPNAKEEDLHKYKYSHKKGVAEVAQKELKRRGLMKSRSLSTLLKNIKRLTK
jgi:hypothetical protein